MNKVDVRIKKIKKDHANLLKLVRGSIVKNQNKFSSEIGKVINGLNYDEKNMKRYEAMKKAQELIVSLTEEILEAKTVEEIASIRSRLNYYINKIKTELKKRNVKQSMIDKYQEKSNYLRKDIAKYIRFLKRKNNIDEIEKLYSNYDNLTKEEKETLKKALRREVSYNNRNLNPKEKKAPKQDLTETKNENNIVSTQGNNFVNTQDNNEDDLHQLDVKFEEKTITDDKLELNGLVFPKSDNAFKEKTVDVELNFIKYDQEKVSENHQCKEISEIEFDDVADFFKQRIEFLSNKYNIVQTYDYSSHRVGKNTITFFRNIPRYIHNKRALKLMRIDYFTFYNGCDLVSFMEYVRRRNSIHQGFKSIFRLSEEAEYLNQGESSKWLYDFCKDNSLDLPIIYQYHL